MYTQIHNTCRELHCAVVTAVIVDDEKKYVIYIFHPIYTLLHIVDWGSEVTAAAAAAEKRH